MLNVVDEFTHKGLAIRVARKLKATDVIDVLSDLFILRGIPGHIRSDNGPEFVAQAVQDWIRAVGSKPATIEPGSPWENGYVESFNARLRDELLNGEILCSLRKAEVILERRRRHTNTVRPHASLGYSPPAPEVLIPALATPPAAPIQPARPARLPVAPQPRPNQHPPRPLKGAYQEDPQGRHPPPRVAGAAAPAGRQHRDQGRRRRQVERGGSDHSPGGPSSCRTRKHGGSKRQVWRRIHIGIDERTLQIRAANLTTSDVGEAPMLPERLDQIPPDQEIGSVTADGAYDTRKCHDAIAERGAHAVIPPRKNAKPWKPDTAGAVARNETLRASRRLGRTIWRRWSGYHRRSRAETKMHCVKLLGQRLSARDFHRQVAEFQIRVAVLNSYTALGRPVTEAVG